MEAYVMRCLTLAPLLLALAALGGCGRTAEEQLAYQHAEEQYQFNMRQSERYRQTADENSDQDSQNPPQESRRQ
ncbi:hypothetical protein [Herbaspirillum robiniae]|nr:hypothetical protein [Herbaspirillum robiniae]